MARWRAAARAPAVVAELEAIFDDAAASIRARGPACWASGRCCNFERAGHRLYVTGLEAAYCVERLTEQPEGPTTVRTLTAASLQAARATGGCPFQSANLCGVHAIKPLGCRLYFCDRAAQNWQHDLSERLLADLRALHDRHAIDYAYGEWRAMLDLFMSDPS